MVTVTTLGPNWKYSCFNRRVAVTKHTALAFILLFFLFCSQLSFLCCSLYVSLSHLNNKKKNYYIKITNQSKSNYFTHWTLKLLQQQMLQFWLCFNSWEQKQSKRFCGGSWRVFYSHVSGEAEEGLCVCVCLLSLSLKCQTLQYPTLDLLNKNNTMTKLPNFLSSCKTNWLCIFSNLSHMRALAECEPAGSRGPVAREWVAHICPLPLHYYYFFNFLSSFLHFPRMEGGESPRGVASGETSLSAQTRAGIRKASVARAHPCALTLQRADLLRGCCPPWGPFTIGWLQEESLRISQR